MVEVNGHPNFGITVVGGGLTGLLAALNLADVVQRRSQKLALIAPVEQSADGRTTALLMPTIKVLEDLHLWEDVKPHTAPLKTMRLVDGSKRLVRAPLTDFRAGEMELEAFGYNVPNAKLIERLEAALKDHPSVVRFDARLQKTECGASSVSLTLDNDEVLSSDLVVAADGRHSIVREAAGITTKNWSYPQTALVLNFGHSQPHNGVSTEFHTETGPFTQVPLPSKKPRTYRSSLVWVVHPEEVDGLLKHDTKELSQIVETKLQSCFGKVTVENKPQLFDLSGMTARAFGKNRVALVGEAGHVFPPIGAQGFNLGVRDIVDLVSLLERAGDDYGAEQLLSSYSRKRMMDVHLRTSGVDVMNRSLLTDFLPVQLARTAGISALGNISPLRKFAMQQGLGARSASMNPFSFWGKGRAAAGRSR